MSEDNRFNEFLDMIYFVGVYLPVNGTLSIVDIVLWPLTFVIDQINVFYDEYKVNQAMKEVDLGD